MANNKVQLADGSILIDLTSDTVTPQTMLNGTTAHASNGEQITGVVNLANAGTSVPLADNDIGSVGSSNNYSREDHVHPLPVYGTNAGFHNSIFRGKNLGSSVTAAQYASIASGTFDNLFIGDYWSIGNNNYIIVDFDYYFNLGSWPSCNKHHIVLMARDNINLSGYTGDHLIDGETTTKFKWNSTNTTAGGYVGSHIRNDIITACDTMVESIFGSDHLFKPDLLLPFVFVSSESGVANDWAWSNNGGRWALHYCELPNETQVFGQQLWGFANNGKPAVEVGIDSKQFAYYRIYNTTYFTKNAHWLRNVVTYNGASFVQNSGMPAYSGTAIAMGIRPRFLLV